MATLSWVRVTRTGLNWNAQPVPQLVVKLNSGQSIVRTHASWGFGGTTDTRTPPVAMMGNIAAFGLVTTIGTGAEPVPSPLASPNNANPPSQRWLFWSVRAPVPVEWDAALSVAAWVPSPVQEESTSEGQVLAPSGMGAGNTLNLWTTSDATAAWDPSGAAIVWQSTAALVRTPL